MTTTTTSTRFAFPPTDGSVPPASAVDFHLKYNPKRLFAILHNVNDSSQIHITFEQLAHAVHRAAHILNPNGTFPQGTNIGFLVSTHTIEYIVMILGAMRAGLVPFPISPRTHLPGIAHLLKSTGTSLVVAGGSQTIDGMIPQLTRNLAEIDFSAQFVGLPTLGSVLPEFSKSESHYEHKPFPPLKPMVDDAIVNILHSSGSTGMPRPIKFHLEGVFKNIITQPLGWRYAQDGVRVGTMALPTFHAMGVFLQILIPLYVGYTQALFAPSHIPVVPTSNLTIEAAASTKCSHLVCVPAFLEMWSQEEAAVAYLRQLKDITFGGGPLAEAIGNKLVDQGKLPHTIIRVRIHSCYGATEFGGVNEVSDLDDLSDWSYVKFSSHVDARFVPQNDENHSFELVFVVSDDHKPFELNSEIDGKPAYRTKDLVIRHPFKPDLWKFVGRLDDQIILLNGEKTNPGPMEAEIVKCPVVHYAVMFGRERNQTGVLIELEESANSLCQTKEGRAKAIEQIWPFIERANQTSPSHSRLERQTVILVDPARPLPHTPKGTVPRSAALKLYAHDIQEMYLDLEKDSGAAEGVEPPQSWTSTEDVEDWISKSVQTLLGKDVEVAGDLFQQGMDSLTATMLLRILKSNLHASSDPNVRSAATKINQQTIFGKPTVRQLAQLLVHLSKNGDASIDPVAEALQNILAMIQKYDSEWPHQEVRDVQPVQKERVVVTGTTGGLGSHLLAQLLENDKVGKVWAMNRKSSKGNKEREVSSFEDKLLDMSLLKSEKLVFVDTDLEDPKLGLSDEAYDEIRSEATLIIHNAWQVNFNLSLQSFEPSIRGARNLLDLGFHSTAPTGLPRFAFASSISVAGFAGPGRYLSEISVTPEMAATSIGYGQSKLVTEKLLESARRAGLQTCTVRLGQLTGDVKSGAWTVTDWVPSLIGSSVSVGCMPGAVGTVSWLPLDVAAHSVIDTCVSRDKELPPVIHTSHPRPVPWMDIMNAFSQSLTSRTGGSQLPIVSFDEWNKRVVEAAASFKGSESDRYKQFPSTKIQSTVDGMVLADDELRSRGEAGNVESGGTVRLDTTVAEEFSETFKSAPELGKEHVQNVSKNGGASVDPVAEALQGIRAMIQKYDSDWSRRGPLGVQLVQKLLESDKARKVWAINRKASKTDREREVASFKDKLLDVNLLKSDKMVFVDVDLEGPKPGLRDEMYNEIRSEATIIIHNAWQVNFNLSLQPFEPSIHGARNLLDLAFNSTAPTGLPRFTFISSVSVAGFTGSERHLSEGPVALEDVATSIGYGQSKIVVEKILGSAGRAGLQTCTIRLGQLAGDVKSGSWSTTDWVPSLIGSSVSVGCFPGATGVVSWLPLDVAAHSIIDTCFNRNVELPSVVHISHPRLVPWMNMLSSFSKSIASHTGSKLPIVRFDEWNKRVVEAAASFKGSENDRYERFPSTKIQSAVDGIVETDGELQSHGDSSHAESGGNVRLGTNVAESLSETLRTTPELGVEHVQKWVGYWESGGLFKSAWFI